ncbi:MAG TPA: TrkA family potassium uptake protein [Gemmatimonadaceae bacterium]|jgi:trk system potassium uptake protein TrkA|nr:TrkA family potassium uptake protein [Gemmatimonadaceae bacterium]
MKRFVIVGLGNFGASIAETLAAAGHEVVAVDSDGARVDRMAPLIERAVVGDATERAVLEKAGCVGADAAVVSVGDDIATSILATLALKDLGVTIVYVKVVSVEHARVMETQGATETVFPERDSAIGLGHRLSGPAGLLNYVNLGPGFSVQEMDVPTAWEGQTLRELNLRQRYRVQVLALRDMESGVLVPVPDPDRRLTAADALLMAGRERDLEKVARA